MEIFQNTLGLLASQEEELLIQISSNRTPILCLAVQTIGDNIIISFKFRLSSTKVLNF